MIIKQANNVISRKVFIGLLYFLLLINTHIKIYIMMYFQL
jgi:hypothetical protein